MKLNKAVKLAIESMRLEIKRIAWDANMYDNMHIDYTLAKNRSKHKKELEEALQLLKEHIDTTPNIFTSYDDYCFTCGVPCKIADAEHKNHETLIHNVS